MAQVRDFNLKETNNIFCWIVIGLIDKCLFRVELYP